MTTTTTVTIASGGNLSTAAYLRDYSLVGIITPSSWTTANLTLQMGFDDPSATSPTYNNVYTSTGSEYTVTAAASRFIAISPLDLPQVEFIKVRSGTSGSPVNQDAARSIKLVLKKP